MLDAALETLGPEGLLLLGVAALVEYLFPPFPGDTVALLGGAAAARTGHSLAVAVVVLTCGSAVGIAATWRVGASLSARLEALDADRRLWGISVATLRAAQDAMRKQGAWLLLANRFIPSFRAVVFVAAGASKLPFGRTMALGVASALAWNLMLVTAGASIGRNAERIEAFLTSSRNAALAALFAVGVLALGLRAWRRRRPPPQRP